MFVADHHLCYNRPPIPVLKIPVSIDHDFTQKTLPMAMWISAELRVTHINPLQELPRTTPRNLGKTTSFPQKKLGHDSPLGATLDEMSPKESP
jgi:hypothetical protein